MTVTHKLRFIRDGGLVKIQTRGVRVPPSELLLMISYQELIILFHQVAVLSLILVLFSVSFPYWIANVSWQLKHTKYTESFYLHRVMQML